MEYFLKLFTISKIKVAKYNENSLIWCFYMLHLYNKCERSVKAVSETLTLCFKGHSAITDFNTVASTGFYCVAAAMLFYSYVGRGLKGRYSISRSYL